MTTLQAANTAVINKYTSYSNSRIDRDVKLYKSANSLIKSAADVKKYIKSVFGATSPQYKQVSGLVFTKP